MSKKKILHLVEAFGGGVFTLLSELCNGLENEFDIIIAYSIREQTPINFKEYFNSNVKFIKIKNFTREINPIEDIKAFFEVKKVYNQEKPDIVHLHSSKAGIIGRLAINGKKTKLFYTPHGYSFLKEDDSKLKRFIYKAIEKIGTISKCTTIACSKGEYDVTLELTKNAIYINNGINLGEIQKLNEDNKNIDYQNLKICTVGRISYQKNPKIFNKIAEKLADIKFIWIGDGELKNELTSPNIEITGWKNREESLKTLNNCDIFILPSLWEGLPISLLEAMYLKKVCIVSNVIGNKDVIKDGINGFIANNEDEYSNLIINLYTYNIKNILGNAKNDVITEYNISNMKNKYSEVYRKE